MALFRREASEERTEAQAKPRRRFQSAFTRVVAGVGVVGIGTALGASLGSQDVDGWIVGLVVSIASVLLAAALSSGRL